MDNLLRATEVAQKTEVVGRLLELWLANPDMRLGQLIENVFSCSHDSRNCFYYKEDYALIEELESAYRKLPK